MSTDTKVEHTQYTSPRSLARMAGACQLLEAMTATFGQVIVLGRLIVSGNAAATAANILGHEQLYWCGFASSIVAVILNLAWAFLMYELLKVVNRRISVLAMFVMLMGCAMLAVTTLFYVAPLVILQGGGSLSAFTATQLQALAAAFLRLNSYAFDLHTVFFVVWCLLTGYLISKAILPTAERFSRRVHATPSSSTHSNPGCSPVTATALRNLLYRHPCPSAAAVLWGRGTRTSSRPAVISGCRCWAADAIAICSCACWSGCGAGITLWWWDTWSCPSTYICC